MSTDILVTARLDSDAGLSDETPEALLVRIACCEQDCRPDPLFVQLSSLTELQLGRSSRQRLELQGEASGRLCLPDTSLSKQHARLLRLVSQAGWFYALEDLGSTNGCRVNGRRIEEPTPLEHGDIVETGRTFWKFWYRPVDQLERLLARAWTGGPVGFCSSLCLDVIAAVLQLEQIAPSGLPVVISGETGTGKEGFASELHRLSGRAGPFVALNCAAIPEGLMESELFGHRKGAFTGAVADKQGLIESAAGGTLLLDEVGDMPLALQAKLLRVLQERSFTRVGETTPRRADVRFAAATHRNLRQMVDEGAFRGDLFARLNGLTITLPPLRERKEDLALLLGTFLGAAAGGGRQVAHGVFRALALYDWPFNIRELEKAVSVALAFASDAARLQLPHLPQEIREATATICSPGGVDAPVADAGPPGRARRVTPPPGVAGPAADDPPRPRKSRPDEPELREVMQQHEGNISAVARALGTTRMQIHRWLKFYDLTAEAFRAPGSDPAADSD